MKTYYSPAHPTTAQSATTTQLQDQTLRIANSRNILVSQSETEGLLALQLSLQAALEALFLASETRQLNAKDIQSLKEELEMLQLQRQYVNIEDSHNVSLSQSEVQIQIAVQAAINLLAQLTVKLIDSEK